MGRLDAKLGLGVGCLVGCQVGTEILDYAVSVYFQIWFYATMRKFARQVRYDRGEKFAFFLRPYLARNFLTPERKNFVVTPKIELPKGLALMLWFRCVQFVFEELISITRATIYCDEFRLYKALRES